MSAPTEPVALLREAARLLREHAAAVDSSNWHAEPRLPLVVVGAADPGRRIAGDLGGDWGNSWYVATELGEPVAKWIALAGPAIAGPLAAWLDEAASQFEYLPPRRHSAQALAVARAIVKAAQR